MSRTRDTAAANEDKDIKDIISGIKSGSASGLKICAAFKSTFGIDIVDARPRAGGSRSTHYDFEILVRDSNDELVWRHVEHKGSQQARPIGPNEKPWTAGVQFHNGGCEKYSLAKKYAHTWYDLHVGSGSLKQEFDITADTPTYEDWFNLDARVQSDPRSEFGKELKRKVRAARGPRTSLLEKREPVLGALEITKEDKQLFIQEVLPIANQALEQKDYWLTIHGPVTGDFHVAWFPKFTITAIKDVIVSKNLDIEFEFLCADEFTFRAILRWGKGAGFSCLRIDLK
jgi:hypothetical protein